MDTPPFLVFASWGEVGRGRRDVGCGSSCVDALWMAVCELSCVKVMWHTYARMATIYAQHTALLALLGTQTE